MSGNKPKHRMRLFWRLFLYGILIILTTTAAAIGVVSVSSEPSSSNLAFTQRLIAELERDYASSPIDIERLHAQLNDLHTLLNADLAVYRTDGSILASAGDFPDTIFAVFRYKHPIMLGSGETYQFLITSRSSEQYYFKMLVGILTILLVLGLLSVPLARTIARPLEQLTQTARSLGHGDLAVRTKLIRGDELGVLATTMDEMAARLEQRIRSERELLANISHELRTPLARIRVALELCDEEETSLDTVQRHLSGIGQDVLELERLVDNVLAVTRLDFYTGASGKHPLVLNKERLRFSLIANETAIRFDKMNPGHTLKVHCADDVPNMELDPVLIRRVLDNLLDNAVKYTTDGTAATIELAAWVEESVVNVEVRDRGIGVAAADLPMLFEPFFRTDRSRSRGTGGTGLGLSLCKRIIELHGGSISARERPGGGLIICIRLKNS